MHTLHACSLSSDTPRCSVWSQREGLCSKLKETLWQREFLKSDNTEGGNDERRALSEGAASGAFERTVGGRARGERLK